MLVLRLIGESLLFAWKALKSNLLRTVLSLLGVTIGIFAIIAVLTLVDSLEKNIKDSLNFLGTGVIYIQKMPFTPETDGVYRWWEYFRRPNPKYTDFKFLEANLRYSTSISIVAGRGNMVVRRNGNNIGQIGLRGVGSGYDKVNEFNLDEGRYFTDQEIDGGRAVVVLGAEVGKALFPDNEFPIGGEVKIRNLKFRVIGVLKKEGQSIIGTPTNDYTVLIPYGAFRKMYQTGTGVWNEVGSSILVKGNSEADIGLVELENEVRGFMRIRRGLRPSEKDNFAMNRPEAIANIISGLFDVVGVAGWVIGGFSILVGGFGIANIMFVSVKERTSIIGLQKSLGAKNYFILFQFLFEAMFLSFIGGLGGLVLVYLLTLVPFGSLDVVLSIKNIVLGITVSSVIGLVAGIVPAAMAARLDPVAAIRA